MGSFKGASAINSRLAPCWLLSSFSESKDGVSIPIRGPVSIQSAFSLEPVRITSTQITKRVSGQGDGSKKSSDTMDMKHRVDKVVYVTFGGMTPQLTDRTGFSDDDAETIKLVLPTRLNF